MATPLLNDTTAMSVASSRDADVPSNTAPTLEACISNARGELGRLLEKGE